MVSFESLNYIAFGIISIQSSMYSGVSDFQEVTFLVTYLEIL